MVNIYEKCWSLLSTIPSNSLFSLLSQYNTSGSECMKVGQVPYASAEWGILWLHWSDPPQVPVVPLSEVWELTKTLPDYWEKNILWKSTDEKESMWCNFLEKLTSCYSLVCCRRVCLKALGLIPQKLLRHIGLFGFLFGIEFLDKSWAKRWKFDLPYLLVSCPH